jgi:hypothetical protein
MPLPSPYADKPVDQWAAITKALLTKHPLKPLKTDELVKTVLKAWDLICKDTVIGGSIRVGVDLFPKPHILGELLHEVIPYLLKQAHPKEWRPDLAKDEKDMVYIPKPEVFSVEIKTSSSASGIFGNRSVSQKPTKRKATKDKSGYFLAVNYTPMHKSNTVGPVNLIRMGWFDHRDWAGQVAPSGQAASLSKDVRTYKLMTLYPVQKPGDEQDVVELVNQPDDELE